MALISIHRDLDIQTGEVIDELANKKRKLDFIIQFEILLKLNLNS